MDDFSGAELRGLIDGAPDLLATAGSLELGSRSLHAVACFDPQPLGFYMAGGGANSKPELPGAPWLLTTVCRVGSPGL